jgi:hypothetical protein
MYRRIVPNIVPNFNTRRAHSVLERQDEVLYSSMRMCIAIVKEPPDASADVAPPLSRREVSPNPRLVDGAKKIS